MNALHASTKGAVFGLMVSGRILCNVLATLSLLCRDINGLHTMPHMDRPRLGHPPTGPAVQPALRLLSRHILHWCTSSVSSVRVISHHQNSRILRLSPALSELLATTIVLMNSRRTMALGTWFTDRLALGPCAFAYTSHCASWPCAPGAVTCDFISTTQIQLLVLREYLLSVLPDD